MKTETPTIKKEIVTLNVARNLFRARRLNQAEHACFRLIEDENDTAEAWHLLGLCAKNRRDFPRAIRRCEKAIACHAEPQYFCSLGEIHRATGNRELALRNAEQALQVRDDFAPALELLGLVKFDAAKFAEAEAIFRRLINVAPKMGRAHALLGHSLREQRKFKVALDAYQTALQLAPNMPGLHSDMGGVLLSLGRLPEALNACQEALRRAPKSALAHANLGYTQQTAGALQDAVASFRSAVELDPSSVKLQLNLGNALVECERQDEALPCYEKAIELDPKSAEARVQLGELLNQLGRFDDAYESFRTALQLNRNTVPAYSNIAAYHRSKITDDDMREMVRLRGFPNLDDRQRAAVHFGLGQVYDAQRAASLAVEEFKLGNQHQIQWLAQQRRSYAPEQHTKVVDSLMGAFTADHFRRVAAWGHASDIPVFVIGLPRSGTTLTEQILASHPEIAGVGEPRFTYNGYQRLPRAMGRQAEPADCVRHLDASLIQQAATWHLRQLTDRHPNAKRIVDKMPENTWYVGWIATLFPNCRIVYCRRDLRDIAVSCWTTYFRDLLWTNSFEHIAHRFEQCNRAMEHWRTVSPVKIFDVRYEELVTDFENVARRLVAWLGADWHPRCLDFYKTESAVRTASLSQVRQPINSKSVARWKLYETELSELFVRLEPLVARDGRELV